MPEIRIEGSFELLSQEEWDAYLGVTFFNEMRIDEAVFGVSRSGSGMPDIAHPRLAEMIFEHNNKVGALSITYALCRHYYDKGIPDDPWHSPGDDGTGIKYWPLFKDEHWMRLYWFNYFSDIYYMKISSVWDSVIEILNHFCGLDYPGDYRLRSKVLKWLGQNATDIRAIFDGIAADQRYKDAQTYRTQAAHGTSPGTVTNTVMIEKDVWTEVPATGPDGKMLIENDRLVMKRVKAKSVVSMRVGDYTNVATIMKNMEEYAVFSGESIQAIIKKLVA